MASVLPEFHLYLTSYSGDFNKERDLVLSEVVPELLEWLDSQSYQLVLTDIRWGGQMTEERVNVLRQDLASTASSPRFFLNVTSESLGLVPHPDDHPPDTIHAYRTALGMKDEEFAILNTAYPAQAQNAVYVLRDDSFLDYLLEEEESFFVKRTVLPDELRTNVNSHCHLPESQVYRFKYDAAGWDYGTNRLEIKLDVPKLTRKICDKVRHQIQAAVLSAPPPELCPVAATVSVDAARAQEDDIQTTFMQAYSQHVHGRDDVIQELCEHVRSGGKDMPVLLLGGEGSGKTCTLTKFSRHLHHNQISRSDGRSWRVFHHFAGATPCSSELHPMLRRLLLAMETVPESGLPKDVDACAALCCMALSNPATQPIVVIVDAVDQFDMSEKAAAIMSWVPRKLAPDVRCIFSTVTGSPQHTVLTRRESTPQELTLEPLQLEHRKQMVADVLTSSKRGSGDSGSCSMLSEERISALLAKPSSHNPLWLTIASQELAQLTSAKQLDQRICSLPQGLLCLLEEVLQRLEAEEEESTLLQATLCLLEASSTGLEEQELLHMLADDAHLTPPSPFDEKEERECSEKECLRRRKLPRAVLPEHRWRRVYETLRPFLRPVGHSRHGRLHFYHRALSRAVRKRYFHECAEENQGVESPELARFWHHKLADYFQYSTDYGRQAEEYVSQLAVLESGLRLVEVLCCWPVFERLYHDEYSPQLLMYWRHAALGAEGETGTAAGVGGGAGLMRDSYKTALGLLEGQEPRDEGQLATRYEQVARVFLQAGVYSDALELCKVSVKWEEKELGNRPERMVELYSLMAEIYDEKLKLNDFVSRGQLVDLRKTISFGRKSIELREKLLGPYHKFRLGMSLMKLAFSLESWEACGGDSQFSGQAALTEGNSHIDKAIEMFKELKDMGHYAEALMTKGVLAPRGSSEQLKYYNEAQEICCQVYGEISLLASRLYINIGIVYEDNEDYIKAFDFFKKWANVSEKVLGPEHPKTLRAKGVLKEPRYRLVAQRLKDLADSANEDGALTEESINQEAGVVVERGHHPLGNHHRENRDLEEGGMADSVDNFVRVTEDLQQAINELLQRALGEVDIGQEVFQNILNTFHATSRGRLARNAAAAAAAAVNQSGVTGATVSAAAVAEVIAEAPLFYGDEGSDDDDEDDEDDEDDDEEAEMYRFDDDEHPTEFSL